MPGKLSIENQKFGDLEGEKRSIEDTQRLFSHRFSDGSMIGEFFDVLTHVGAAVLNGQIAQLVQK